METIRTALPPAEAERFIGLLQSDFDASLTYELHPIGMESLAYAHAKQLVLRQIESVTCQSAKRLARRS